jgi:hypothetical protein
MHRTLADQVRGTLELSTYHLPLHLVHRLADAPGVIADELPDGLILMHVPAAHQVPADAEPAVVVIWEHARRLHCNRVLFDPETPTVDPHLLPVFPDALAAAA